MFLYSFCSLAKLIICVLAAHYHKGTIYNIHIKYRPLPHTREETKPELTGSVADPSHTVLADLQPFACPLPAPGEELEHENHLRRDHFLSSHAVDHSYRPRGHSLQLFCLMSHQLKYDSKWRLREMLVSATITEQTVTSLRSSNI